MSGGWKLHRVETAWILFGIAAVAALVHSAIAGSRSEAGIEEADARSSRMLLLAVMAVTMAVYARGLTVGLLSDDFVLLETSPEHLGWAEFFRPLPLAVFWLAERADPARVAGVLHGLILLLHLINGWLVWVASQYVGIRGGARVVAAALFLLFPGSVEAVVWCASLQDVAATTASLGFIVLALAAGPPWLMIISLAAALTSKESAVAVPFIAAGLLLARDGWQSHASMKLLGWCAVACVCFALWRLQAADAYFNVRPTRYVLKNLLSMTFENLAVPLWVAEVRRWPLAGVFASLATAGVALCATASRRPVRSARMSLALLVWVVAAVVPAYTWLFVGDWLEGSRHLYLASAGWSLLLVSAEASGPAANVVRRALIAVVVLWTVATYSHVEAWMRAASERDRILAAARQAQRSACASPRFLKATDNVQGAYVFRNGIDAALRRLGIGGDQSSVQSCDLVWDGTRFVPSAGVGERRP